MILRLEQLKKELCKCSCAGLVASAEHAHRDAPNNILNPLACSHHLNRSVFQAPGASAESRVSLDTFVSMPLACVFVHACMRASCVRVCLRVYGIKRLETETRLPERKAGAQ